VRDALNVANGIIGILRCITVDINDGDQAAEVIVNVAYRTVIQREGVRTT
jgi:hypothetical protein